MTLLERVGTEILQPAGVGTMGVDIFASRLPDGPFTAVGLIESPASQGPEYTLGDVIFEGVSFQVIARAAYAEDAEAKAELAYEALLAFRSGQLGTRYVTKCQVRQQPFQLPPNSLDHFRYVFNVEMDVRR